MGKINKIKITLVWVLPAVLLIATWVIYGCYYESNDDVAISQVIRGETAIAPVYSLHLYFHGFSAILASLYQIMPSFPWYGILLYLLLYSSLILVHQILYEALEYKMSLTHLCLCLVLLYWFTWQETALLMNYTRIPILLSGVGILYATKQRTCLRSFSIGVAVAFLGWCIRPSTALLGLLVAAPGAWWLARYKALLPVIGTGVLMLTAIWVLSVTYSPEENRYRHIDIGNAYYLDYGLYQHKRNTTEDNLGIKSVDNWAFGDSTVVNEKLFNEKFYFDKYLFLRQTAPDKVISSYRLLRRYCLHLVLFPVIVSILVFTRIDAKAKEFLLTQVGFALLLLSLSAVFKLPLRLASPLCSLWVLCVLLYIVNYSPWLFKLKSVWQWGLCIAVLSYAPVVWQQSREYRQKRLENEAYLRQVYLVAKHRTLVSGGIERAYQYLSPFSTYELSDLPVLTLMGWLTLEPSLSDLRQHMTGTRDFENSILRLANKPNTLWIMHEPFASFIESYTQMHRPTAKNALSLELKRSLSTNPQFAKVYSGKVINK
ncbi:hypothetical protein J0X19_13190 [Hymenobacter sp. BT186]|uniref:Uncharacterized protein n=1 Tax=Hymenobacter telluris TaxID=2816474 RepID=A0A939EXE7_9BACT|nr:hypothetical protein [Hymenobacter telluris]MBO0358906.1 hypothetical protein [Hymenobacter telluris]MBW3374932.1 hypothetical protein [Hymenobacter norwichensis]